jgi:hypothetical protein
VRIHGVLEDGLVALDVRLVLQVLADFRHDENVGLRCRRARWRVRNRAGEGMSRDGVSRDCRRSRRDRPRMDGGRRRLARGGTCVRGRSRDVRPAKARRRRTGDVWMPER